MKLSAYLAKDGVTATMLAKKLNVKHSTVLRWADGSIEPNVSRLRAIETATGGEVRAQDFYGDQWAEPAEASL